MGDDVFAVLHGIAQQKIIQFVCVKANQIQVEVFFLKSSQLDAKHFLIPTGADDRQLVIGYRQSATLRLTQAIQFDDWNVCQAQLSGSKEARVAGYDNEVWANKYRIRPAELADAGGDQRYLRVRMCS